MLRVALLVVGAALAGCSDRPTPVSVETPRGTISYKERVRPDDGTFEAGLRGLTVAESERLKAGARSATSLIERYVPQQSRQTDLLENLDLAFAAWLNSSSPNKESVSEIELIIGAALGQYCIDRLPVRWAVAKDEQGNEFVVVGENPPSRSYPFASVRYRIEDGKTDFVGALYEALVHLRQKTS